MKVNFINDKIILYDSRNIDFENKNRIENYFKDIFLRLKKIHDIEIDGFYLIKIYYDNNIGMIIEIQNEKLEYYDFYNDEIDMKINVENTNFLFKIDDIFIDNKLLNYVDIINYNDNIYLKIKKKLDNTIIGYIFEIGKIKYKDTEYIIKHSKKLL